MPLKLKTKISFQYEKLEEITQRIFRSNGARTNAHILHAVTPTTKYTTKRPKTKQNKKFGKHQNNGPKIIAHNADEHNNKWK